IVVRNGALGYALDRTGRHLRITRAKRLHETGHCSLQILSNLEPEAADGQGR
ncbi:MAG: hypothetical protein RLZZ314_754, partial [Bacteroidota bacterium]